MTIPNTDPTGISDSTAGLQNYIDGLLATTIPTPPGSRAIYPDIVLPMGHFKISAPLDLSGTTAKVGRFGIRGAPGATVIFGNFNGYLITKSNTAIGVGPSYVRDIHFLNRNNTPMTSGCLDLQGGQGVNMTGLSFQSIGGVCINFNRTGANNVYATHINGCIFTGGNVAAQSTAIGILANGQVSIVGCDFTVFSEGLRLANAAYFIGGCRFEVNKTAINIGRDYLNNLSTVGHIGISGIGMEANDVCLNVAAAQMLSVNGIGGDGTGNAPSGMSKNGIIIAPSCGNAVFSGVVMHGNFTNNAIQCASPSCVFINVRAGNGLGGPTWVMSAKGSQFINCTQNVNNSVSLYTGQ